MKKVFAVLVAFGIGVGVGALLQDKAPVAQAGQGPQCAPLLVTEDGEVIQDMNGDGAFDAIGEALRLLSWAFLGGPAPVPPCAERVPCGLPDTGQTQCFTCSGPRCEGFIQDFLAGQDGFQNTGCPNDANRFTDNGDGTVTDHCTGLMWQKNMADLNGDGVIGGPDAPNWCGALEYAHNLTFAGHDDWRIPNVRELQSIINYGPDETGMDLPAMDPVFRGTGDTYWTSTSNAGAPELAWCIEFSVGESRRCGKALPVFIRAVRSAP